MPYRGFCGPNMNRIKIKETEKIEKDWSFLENKKFVEHVRDGNTNCNWRTRKSFRRLDKETERVENPRTNRDHPLSKYWEESRRLTVIQNPVKDHQLTLMWRRRNVIIFIIIVIKKTQQRSRSKESTDKILSITKNDVFSVRRIKCNS